MDTTRVSREYVGVASIRGPLMVVEDTTDVGFDEMVEVLGPQGDRRIGRVLSVSRDAAVVEVFEGTSGLSIPSTAIRFLGRPLTVPVSLEMLGRIFDGLGRPIDGGPEPLAREWRDINGSPINPSARAYPSEFIQTGISTIDGMNTLVRGQKLPIFSASGLQHNTLAAQIASQARIARREEFCIVFAAMGIVRDVATFFQRRFEESGALENSALFLNLAEDPSTERVATPRMALTVAEYLAFQEGKHVLVILTDMTNYCEALREISSAREEVPARRGYPGYLYSDLAAIYERTGRIKGVEGSITQMPILTMPNDDITHPVPDLTGYITEGQIVLSRELGLKNIYPPVDVLPSLSRLMKDGIGEGHTRSDHPDIASQLYAAYARVKEVRSLASIIGEEELTGVDRSYLRFGEEFETRFVRQGTSEDRDINATLDLAWDIVSLLPRSELFRVTEEEIRQRYRVRKPGD
ncbi:MAG: V-type ATP synthase subunit B [Dehalococcoidales bacterium]|nr:V-type ATP synthase subunit B [Dehalococcoidales bacterium]